MLVRCNIFVRQVHMKFMQEIRHVNVRVIKNPITIKDVAEKHVQKEILQVELGISYQRSLKLVRNNKYIEDIKNERLRDTIKTLKQLGIESEDIYNNPSCLNIMNSTIEHNVLYLKEAGFKNVSAYILIKFHTFVRKRLSFLKLHGVIPENTNVVEKLCSYLTLDGPNVTDIENLTDDDELVRIREILLKKYLVSKLQTTEKTVEKIFRTYNGLKYKSFQLVVELMMFLLNELNFTNEKILHHGYLFSANTKSVKNLLDAIPSIGNVDMKIIIFRHPKLMTVSAENIQTILQHLHDFGIADDAITKCFEILTISPDSVLQRLIEFKKVPEFDVLAKNPRVVFLLYSQTRAKLRLELLKSLNLKCTSLHMLCASDSIFERYTQDGNDKTKGVDIVSYLAMELNSTTKAIRESLRINHFWNHVPLTAIESSLKYLLSIHMSNKDINRMPLVLLYSKNQLEEALKEMHENSELKGIKLTNLQMLNLCLYVIEKKHHFSGNGMWLTKDKECI